jgi:hypothetical protein
MKNTLLTSLFIILTSIMSFGTWQDKEMKRINKKITKISNCKCPSKTQEIDKNAVKFYFTPKKIQLVKIVEKRTINGHSVNIQYFFDKKTNQLIAVSQGSSIYYFQKSGYFAVLSNDNFTPDEAKKRAKEFSDTAQKYISKLE